MQLITSPAADLADGSQPVNNLKRKYEDRQPPNQQSNQQQIDIVMRPAASSQQQHAVSMEMK
jgi:hypothetical protein